MIQKEVATERSRIKLPVFPDHPFPSRFQRTTLMRHFLLATIAAALGLSVCAARAETLQHKFGFHWNCSYISIEKKELYDLCVRCEANDMDTEETAWNQGKCVRRLSLREKVEKLKNGGSQDEQYDGPEFVSPQEEIMRRNSAAAAARELQELQRLGARPMARESDVSGAVGGRLAPAPRGANPSIGKSLPTRESGVSGPGDPVRSGSNSPSIGSKPSGSNVGGVHVGVAPTGQEADLGELRRKILNLRKPDT